MRLINLKTKLLRKKYRCKKVIASLYGNEPQIQFRGKQGIQIFIFAHDTTETKS